jgi:mRNA interferase RelE/StbE
VTYVIILRPAARRSLAQRLPKSVAPAVVEFIYGPLAENPHKVGKPLRDSLSGTYSARRGNYRVLYEIHETEVVVEVVKIAHRRDAYR